MQLRSPMTVILLVVAAAILILVGIAYQLGVFGPLKHAISYHAIAFWAAAIACLVAASFARPRKPEGGA